MTLQRTSLAYVIDEFCPHVRAPTFFRRLIYDFHLQAVETFDEGVRLLILTDESHKRRKAVHADLVRFWGQQAVDNPDLRSGSPELFDDLWYLCD